MQEVSGVIVARGGSVRIPKKSMLKLGEETLIARKIRQLQETNRVDRVIFGSDDWKMLEHANKCGAEVFERPKYFCDEKRASANDMIGNMLTLFKTDIVVWAHCTNPFISSQTYDLAIQSFLEAYQEGRNDSLLSVVELREHLWCKSVVGGGGILQSKESVSPLNYNPFASRHIPASKLEPYYMQDGGIFIQPYQQMLQNSYFFGKNPLLFVVPEEEFLDINTQRDYLLAKALLSE